MLFLLFAFLLLVAIFMFFSIRIDDVEVEDRGHSDPFKMEYAPTMKTQSKFHRRVPRTTRPYMHYRLPREIVDEIVDYLFDDIPTLKSCALASPIFLPRCRLYLFGTLRVRKHGLDPYSLRFYPSVAQHIRNIIVEGKLLGEVMRETNAGVLPVQKIEKLRLEGSPRDWTQTEWTLSKSQLPAFANLRELSLSRVYFRSFNEMVRTLGSFPRLSSLSLDFEDHRYSLVSTPDVAACMFALPIERLHMRMNMSSNISSPGVGLIPQILVHSAGRYLKHLSLDILSSTSGSGLLPVSFMHNLLDLSRSTSLQSLSLSFTYYTTRSPWRTWDNSQLSAHLLSRIHSQHFSELTLNVFFVAQEITTTRWLRHLDLRYLDNLIDPAGKQRAAAISHPAAQSVIHTTPVPLSLSAMDLAAANARRLRKVTLQMNFPRVMALRELQMVETILTAQLPRLTASGILSLRTQCLLTRV
ncbi:hypothetical protein K474DRAFT_1666365 [Panus rudis PR-1116 ss-1]|nr:hypothetical protein K474DRAFT_1666365 [Panus rudis PR-1116 ss-1]